jgi:hypothetical protein
VKKSTAPLRRIVYVIRHASSAWGAMRVRLECGHDASASASAIYRARCLKCAAPEVKP